MQECDFGRYDMLGERRQSGLKIGGSRVLKLNKRKDVAQDLGYRPRKCLLNIHKSVYFCSHHFGKCSHLVFLYIIGYNNISWRSHDPTPKSGGRDLQPPHNCYYLWYERMITSCYVQYLSLMQS